jgi:hypothetical protein
MILGGHVAGMPKGQLCLPPPCIEIYDSIVNDQTHLIVPAGEQNDLQLPHNLAAIYLCQHCQGLSKACIALQTWAGICVPWALCQKVPSQLESKLFVATPRGCYQSGKVVFDLTRNVRDYILKMLS